MQSAEQFHPRTNLAYVLMRYKLGHICGLCAFRIDVGEKLPPFPEDTTVHS